MTPVKNPLLHRYWLEFDRGDGTEPLACGALFLGCGVTAFTADDAKRLVRESIFGDEPMPSMARIIEDVDITTLDDASVRPNMHEPISRGIWYPIGYRTSGGSP
ncbi:MULTISPECIES: hypothetical protein [Myxococcus]|uniref:hypothetical protein n=1 Tax=Myxococcus TaxID=32 RepID=UPI0011474766|nr:MULTISPECIES: hypothetical protein [Myxococcus]QQR45582.1 hypothetical protein JKA73_05460 [Myxococcus xanthus]